MGNNVRINFDTIDGKPIRCKLCGGRMIYVAGGEYQCEYCKAVDYDDFGKVKNFLEEFGTAPAPTISKVTGVSEIVIENFLKDGRIQIAPNSKYFIKCESCGANIRFGRFCQKCILSIVGRIESAFDADRTDVLDQDEMAGKMRFFKNKE